MATEEKQETQETASAEAAGEAAAQQAQEEHPAEDAGAGNDPTAELLARIEQLAAEAEESRQRYLRAVADLENFRKRAVREKEEARKYATSAFVEELLPVLDHFVIGLDHARKDEANKAFVEGFEMVLNQLRNVFAQNGIQELNPVGGAFDPNLHESVAHVPSDSVPDGHVIEVTRVGYRLNDRLLRPATVVVSSGAPSASE